MREIKFPKAVIFILDDDIIQSTIKSNKIGATIIFTKLIDWLFTEINSLITQRKEQLPPRALKAEYPRVYWVEAPQHKNFQNNLLRRKLNSVIQTSANKFPNFRIMRMKKIWNQEDSNLFRNNRFSAEGLAKYSAPIDNALEFNDTFKMPYISQNHRPTTVQVHQ